MAKGKKTGGRNFQPGVVTNPTGRPPEPPELKLVKQMNQGEFKVLMHKLMNLEPKDLVNFQGTLLEMTLASIIKEAIKNGDPHRLQYFTDRLFGKVSDKLELEIKPVENWTREEKIKLLKESEEGIKKLKAELDSE